MAERITTSELGRQPGKYVGLAMNGEAVHLTRHGKVVAIILPAEEAPGQVVTREPIRPTILKGKNGPIATQATSSSSSVADTQMIPTDASHPAKRPTQQNDAQRAQAERDRLLGGARKNRG